MASGVLDVAAVLTASSALAASFNCASARAWLASAARSALAAEAASADLRMATRLTSLAVRWTTSASEALEEATDLRNCEAAGNCA